MVKGAQIRAGCFPSGLARRREGKSTNSLTLVLFTEPEVCGDLLPYCTPLRKKCRAVNQNLDPARTHRRGLYASLHTDIHLSTLYTSRLRGLFLGQSVRLLLLGAEEEEKEKENCPVFSLAFTADLVSAVEQGFFPLSLIGERQREEGKTRDECFLQGNARYLRNDTEGERIERSTTVTLSSPSKLLPAEEEIRRQPSLMCMRFILRDK